MGRIQPTKKSWVDLGPDWVGPISAQQAIMLLLVWAGPGPDLKAGPEPVWPRRKKTGRGINFPLPSSCMQQDYACRRKTLLTKTKCRGEDVTWRGGGGRWWCCGGVAHVRRLRAVLWRFERRRERLLPILCFRFVFSFCFRSVQVFPFYFSLSSLFLFVWFLLASLSFVLSLLPFGFFFLSLSPSVSFSIYRRESVMGPSLVRLGSGFRGRLVGQ